MIDRRFYNKKSHLSLENICGIIGAETPKNADWAKQITSIARLDNATESDITFFHNTKYTESLGNTKAFACIIDEKHKDLLPKCTIPLVVTEPYLALALLLREFYSTKENTSNGETFVSTKSSVSKLATIEDSCYISDFVSVGDGCIIKKGTFIGANTSILPGVEIGENSHIESNVTIGFAVIGNSAYIKTGARIGQQGFGFHVGKAGPTDILQIGRVIIGNNVQIGANCTIDRGSMGDTKIGNCARIDDMVHIAHNVHVGDYCIFAAQTGIAGSTKIGMGCVFAGQVGISGHLTLGDKVTVAAQSGVMRNIESGSKVGGSPAINIMNWHRQTVILKKLVEDRNTK